MLKKVMTHQVITKKQSHTLYYGVNNRIKHLADNISRRFTNISIGYTGWSRRILFIGEFGLLKHSTILLHIQYA